MKKIIIFGLSIILLSGCATRLGEFTTMSTHNVRNMNYSIANNTKTRTNGDSCIHIILLFIPIGHFGDRLTRAVDEAIYIGQNKGVDGDILVNARVNHSFWTTIIYGQDCIKVEGDLVRLEK